MAQINRRGILQGTLGAAALAGSGARFGAFAQGSDWPNRPVRFIVPLAPGGAIDFIARAVGERMSPALGQQVIVENRTGAGGTIGMDAAMKSAPDGYTVLITNDNAASAPHIMKLSYDYTKEMMPVCFLGRHGQIFAAHSSIGVKSLKELLDYTKAHPGVGIATSGVGSNQHVLCEWIKKETGLKFEHVPYRGAGQAINDLIAAHVKTAILGPTSMMPHAAAGTVKMLVTSANQRSKLLPEVPTFEDEGFKGMRLEAWYGAFAPAGTPPALVARLNAEMNKALQDPKLIDTFTKGAIEPVGGTPEQFGAVTRTDSEKYARLIKELNLTITQ
ncbi:MAG: tripartite tricarboxylate transporter substrate binding protein [Pseudolabrys sp.]|nr:tripartite tricarboxylate transporter substrate binding protein [Pseudolabrys sp.]